MFMPTYMYSEFDTAGSTNTSDNKLAIGAPDTHSEHSSEREVQIEFMHFKVVLFWPFFLQQMWVCMCSFINVHLHCIGVATGAAGRQSPHQ